MVTPAGPADDAGIVRAATDYAASWLEGDPERMVSCLHPALAKRTMAAPGSDPLDLREAPFERLVASAGRGPKPYGPGFDVRTLDFIDGIASAAVSSEPWLDLLHLARFDDRWLIVNALYEPTAPAVDRGADRAAVMDLLGSYLQCGLDGDVELARGIHHPALVERKPTGSGLDLDENPYEEVLRTVGGGVGLDPASEAGVRVLEVGRDIAAGFVAVDWLDAYLHAGRFGDRWLIVNVLYRVREDAG